MKALLIFVYLFSVQALGAFPLQGFDDMVREHLKWENTKSADAASDILHAGLAVSPLIIGIAHDHPTKEILGVVAGQAAVSGLTHVVKVGVGRQRPNGSDYRSFFSGHTSSAFAGAAGLCRMDKSFCTSGFLFAGMTGYLRIAADKHWATDVVTGAIIGTAGGHYVPGVVIGW